MAARIPCSIDCNADCSIRNVMLELEKNLVPPPSGGAAELVDTFFDSYRKLCKQSRESRDEYPPSLTFPALFDFVVSAKYAERMIADDGWTYCAGTSVKERPALYFPFLETCPRCSVKLGIRPQVPSNKPKSDIIGNISSDVTCLILSRIVSFIDPKTQIFKSSRRQGDVDLVVLNSNIIGLAEIKSSPLVVYPLEITLLKQMTEVRDGETVPKEDHTRATIGGNYNISLYIPHKDVRIPLGSPNTDRWPFKALVEFVQDYKNVAILVSAWKELYQVYISEREGQETDNRKWLTCGCGGKVDDSKNLPGLDRTDDIKKGTYQVLKFGTSYKEKCPQRFIKALLVSNLWPVHSYHRYLAGFQDLIWTKEKYSVTLKEKGLLNRVRAFKSDSVFNLYDAIFCLTNSMYRDQQLWAILSLDKFMGRFCL